MELLLALQNKDIREVATFALESQLGVKVLPVKSSGEAIDLLIRNEGITLLVLEHPAISEPVLKFLKSSQRKLATFLCVDPGLAAEQWQADQARLKPTGFTQNPDWVAGIAPLLRDYLKSLQLVPSTLAAPPGAEAAPADADPEHQWARIRPNLLLMASPLKGDVYIKLSDQKFVKLFKAGADFDKNDYDKYVTQKNVEFLWIRPEDAQNFVERLQAKLAATINADALDEDAAAETSISLHQTVRELIHRIEPTEALSPLIKESTRLTLKAVGRNPKLKGIISKLTLDPKSYISSHSIALSQLACGLAAALEWGSETTFHKLNMAAFLHDIVLENQALARIHSLEELNARKDEFTPKEVAEYPLHPMRGSDLARKFPEIPPDVDLLIAQHHELPDGTGFPRHLSAKQISPLSAVFIVAHELVHFIYEKGPDFQMKDFLEANLDRYNNGQFKKILACLIKTKT